MMYKGFRLQQAEERGNTVWYVWNRFNIFARVEQTQQEAKDWVDEDVASQKAKADANIWPTPYEQRRDGEGR